MPPTPIKSTTQEHLDILDISRDLVLIKDGSAALIIQVSAVNFDLLSEEEQEAIIYAYAGLLNSLTFPIQILVKSQKKDVSNYLKLLKEREDATTSINKKQQISQYREFITQIVKEGNVLDKKFYCIIPFSRIELGLQASNPLSLKKHTELPYDKAYILDKALTVLNPRKDHLIRQFADVGLIAKQLNTQELIQLFYNAYNPDQAKEKTITQAERFDSPMVQSKLSTTPDSKPTTTPTETLKKSPLLQTPIHHKNQPQNPSINPLCKHPLLPMINPTNHEN